MLIIIGKPDCKYCEKAKDYCEKNSLTYSYYDMTKSSEMRDLVVNMGAEAVPQIFDGFKHIGGFTELTEYFK